MRDKHHDLVVARKATGYATKLITLEVGSQGMVNIADFAGVQEAVHAPEIDYIADIAANNPGNHHKIITLLPNLLMYIC